MTQNLEPLALLREFYPARAMFLCGYVSIRNSELQVYPKWREMQLIKLIGQLTTNADEMKAAYEQERVMRLSWAVRNLLDLSIWVDYCNLSEENAERFHKDSARDAIGWAGAIQKHMMSAVGARSAALDRAMGDVATQFSLGSVDEDFQRVADAAEAVGRTDSFVAFSKYCSKYAHPTAWALSCVLANAVIADEELRAMLLRDGVAFAIKAFTNIRTEILRVMPMPADIKEPKSELVSGQSANS